MDYYSDSPQVDWKRYRDDAEKMLTTEGWIPIFERFCPELENIIVSLIFSAKNRKKDFVTLIINSNGGSISSLVAIKSALKITMVKTVGIVMGKARSAGFQLLQQCDVRYAVNGSYLMPHWGSGSFGNNELAAIMSGDLWPIEHEKSIRGLLFNDVQKRTGMDPEELQKIYDTDRDFTAEEALGLNFIDKVIDKFTPEDLNPFKS
jgi:ATP-dependent protease ClpP protease subunit